jgi:hypothetical protein
MSPVIFLLQPNTATEYFTTETVPTVTEACMTKERPYSSVIVLFNLQGIITLYTAVKAKHL